MATPEIVTEMVARIQDVVRPDKIILFGSQARQEVQPDSDFDLLIIAPSALPRWANYLTDAFCRRSAL